MAMGSASNRFFSVLSSNSAYVFLFAVAVALVLLLAYETLTVVQAQAPANSYLYCIGGHSPVPGGATNSVYFTSLSGNAAGTWYRAVPYPHSIGSASCAYGNGSIGCVGGFNSSLIYSASCAASISGNSQWNCSDYPENMTSGSCIGLGQSVLCTGGVVPVNAMDTSLGNMASNLSYYTGNLAGMQPWHATTGYPIQTFGAGCALYNSTVYCVGGYEGTAPYAMNSSYYATVTANGISEWEATTPYPLHVVSGSCFASFGYLYCIGGSVNYLVNSSIALVPNFTGRAYYAKISQQGIGKWMNTTSYPVNAIGVSCADSSAKLYCIGGLEFAEAPGSASQTFSILRSAYYANLTANGIGTWHSIANYPEPTLFSSCLAVNTTADLEMYGSRVNTTNLPAAYTQQQINLTMLLWDPT